ncbi:hypothetical protein [Mucilaginibacter lappiensis]|uniref:Uncharacterized protein n=1 Tax=Mucilaginibacter lappiensis TaxID=354630 RepID=A0A1N6UWQ7_9SPHI|nr:hypothetical protein [Mucilaginibacter lappiensis]MBB6108972.1 hypothetical protein [Mucilaginibacter lappiensis]MBB6130565.1 hypothetical protein [Mucilaginibacter lappiensis]SIQ69991.1 hypothetical protein SAMN05421821_103206 [Mucilaginibacter lappiensis]
MSIYNKINAGFKLGTADPITAGIEDVVYIFNQNDVTLTYDITNPLIVTGLTAVSAAKVYKFEGTNNSFGTTSKLAKTQVGPRYTEEIDFNIAGLSVDIKTQLTAMGYGRVCAITVNNYKSSDSAIELFGAVNGLILTDAERNAADETLDGGYKLKLTNPDKLKEPYPPRAVSIAPQSGTATYASTIAALEALVAA